MADFVPLCLQFLHLVEGGIGCVINESSQLLDDASLGFEVLAFLVALVCRGSLPSLEELVAGGGEALPQLLAIFAGHGADGLPLLLQLDEAVGGAAPFGALLQGFCLFHQLALGFEVLALFVLDALVELCLGGEEAVAGSTEAVEDEVVLLVAGEPDGLPFGLEGDDLLGLLLPLGEGRQFVELDVLHLLAEGGLLLEVLLFACLDGLEVLLMTLVDDGAGSLEALPDLVAQFLGYGAYFLIFCVQALQFVEGGDDVFLVGQLLCQFNQAFLGGEVLPEVILACFAVQLQQVVELLHVVLIGLPDFRGALCWHGSDFLPLGLQLLKLVEVLTNLFRRSDQFLDALDDGEFLLEVLGLLLLHGFSNLGSTLADACHDSLEVLLGAIDFGTPVLGLSAIFDEGVAGSDLRGLV